MSTYTDLRAAASPALRDWIDAHADHVAAVIADLPTAGARNVTDQHLADLHRGVGRARVGAPGRKLVRVEWDRRIDAEIMKLEALDNSELSQIVDREVVAVVNTRSGVLPRAGTQREALERVFQQRTGHSLYASAEGMVDAARRLHPRARTPRTERDTLIAEIRTLGDAGRTLVDAERFKWKVADLSGLLPTEQQLASTMRNLDDLREWRDELRTAMDAYTAKHKATAPVVEVEAPRLYRYGAQNRPIGFATVPKGHVRIEPPVARQPLTRHGVVVYDRPLTDDEVRGYELAAFMDADTLVEKLYAALAEYGAEYADFIREDGIDAFRVQLEVHLPENVYTDVPFAELTRRVADRLLAAYPAP